VADGELEEAIVMVLRDLLEFADEQMEERRAEPEWPAGSPRHRPSPAGHESEHEGRAPAAGWTTTSPR